MTRNRPVPDISPEDAAFVRSLVLHEDDALIAFNKPSGLPVQAGRGIGQSLDFLLAAFARSNGKRPRLVHRLDAGTSGLIIVAKTQPAAAALSAEFAERRARKSYVAIVAGQIPAAISGAVNASLVKVQESGRARMIVARADRKAALSAHTGWKILDASGDKALIQLFPETGRMHQIRIHLSHLGCPILGDPIYGTGTSTAERLMLHALSLEIAHPAGGNVELSAPLPPDFSSMCERIGFKSYSGLK